LHEITKIEKSHIRKTLGRIFSDSACFSHAKTTEQVDDTFFFSWNSNSQGVQVCTPPLPKEYKEQTEEGPFTDFAPCCLNCSRTPKRAKAVTYQTSDTI
jgi:hypothetical protein